MIMKNGKTILFASLLMAMILPFSMMDNATADKDDKILRQIDKTIAKYEKALENTDESKIKRVKHLTDSLTKINIIREIHTINQVSTLIDNSDNTKKLRELYNELQPFMTDYVDSSQNVWHEPSEVYDTKTNKHKSSVYDCKDKRTITASTDSTLTMYENGDATIKGTLTAPDDYNKSIKKYRQSTKCLNFDHVETEKKYSVILSTDPSRDSPSQVCTLETSKSYGTDFINCNAIGKNQIVLITSHFKYDSGIEIPYKYSILFTVG